MNRGDKAHLSTSPTLSTTVAQRLRDEILSGAFPPGTALREIPLADRYGSSRQTVREALRALSDLGMLELYERRGAIIPKLSPRRARETYTMRALIEPFALRMALVEGRIKSGEIEIINAAYEHMRVCAQDNDVASLIEADMAFHWALCSPCDHRILLEFLERLQTATRQSMIHMKVYGSDAEGEVESHAPILHAVHARDADGAANAMHNHIIQNGERLLMKVMESMQD